MDDKTLELASLITQAHSSLVSFRRIFFPTDDEVEPAPFHEEWSDLILNSDENLAMMGFRESSKTDFLIRNHTLHRLGFPTKKYRYFVFLLATAKQAEAKLKEISRTFQSTPILNSNIVEIHQDSGPAFEATLRALDGELITVRIEAYGKGASIRGAVWGNKRPDIVYIDDPQDTEDARSEETMKADWDWFLSDIKFLGRKTRIIVLGNNLGDKCIVHRLVTGAPENGFVPLVVPILDGDTPAWPERFPMGFIQQEREEYARIGKLDVWYRERMCVSLAPESQIFRKEWFQYYDKAPTGLSVYMTIDLAISQKSTADFTAICVMGVNRDNHWFILDYVFGRFDPTRTIDEVFALAGKWRPIRVGIEKVAFQAAMEHFIQKEMPKRNSFFAVHPLDAATKKEQRIQMLQPRFALRTVWFPEGKDFLAELESELLAFTPQGTKGLHDDLIDALAYMEQIAIPPSGGYDTIEDDMIPLAGGM